MNAQDVVNTIAQKTSIDQPTTEKVVGTILSVIQHEVDAATVEPWFAKLPGADQLAQQYDVMRAAPASGGGGLLGSLQSALGGILGGKAGALVNGVAQLESTGLSMAQIQQAAATLIQQAKTAAGPQLTSQVLDSVPGLKSQLGL